MGLTHNFQPLWGFAKGSASGANLDFDSKGSDPQETFLNVDMEDLATYRREAASDSQHLFVRVAKTGNDTVDYELLDVLLSDLMKRDNAWKKALIQDDFQEKVHLLRPRSWRLPNFFGKNIKDFGDLDHETREKLLHEYAEEQLFESQHQSQENLRLRVVYSRGGELTYADFGGPGESDKEVWGEALENVQILVEDKNVQINGMDAYSAMKGWKQFWDGDEVEANMSAALLKDDSDSLLRKVFWRINDPLGTTRVGMQIWNDYWKGVTTGEWEWFTKDESDESDESDEYSAAVFQLLGQGDINGGSEDDQGRPGAGLALGGTAGVLAIAGTLLAMQDTTEGGWQQSLKDEVQEHWDDTLKPQVRKHWDDIWTQLGPQYEEFEAHVDFFWDFVAKPLFAYVKDKGFPYVQETVTQWFVDYAAAKLNPQQAKFVDLLTEWFVDLLKKYRSEFRD